MRSVPLVPCFPQEAYLTRATYCMLARLLVRDTMPLSTLPLPLIIAGNGNQNHHSRVPITPGRTDLLRGFLSHNYLSCSEKKKVQKLARCNLIQSRWISLHTQQRIVLPLAETRSRISERPAAPAKSGSWSQERASRWAACRWRRRNDPLEQPLARKYHSDRSCS